MKCNLPEVEFSISYPNNVKVVEAIQDQNNDNYISIVIKEKGIVEELSIGWFTGNYEVLGMFGFGDQLLNQFKNTYQNADPNAEVVFQGQKKFLGNDLYQLQMRYEMKSEETEELEKWMINIVLYPGKSENGILLIFQTAGKDTQIKDFSDFGKKGLTGEIWQTFTWN